MSRGFLSFPFLGVPLLMFVSCTSAKVAKGVPVRPFPDTPAGSVSRAAGGGMTIGGGTAPTDVASRGLVDRPLSLEKTRDVSLYEQEFRDYSPAQLRAYREGQAAIQYRSRRR